MHVFLIVVEVLLSLGAIGGIIAAVVLLFLATVWLVHYGEKPSDYMDYNRDR